MLPGFLEAQNAFKDSMIHEVCNSHYLSQFAAFFIVARAKRSVVKSCLFVFKRYLAITFGVCQEIRRREGFSFSSSKEEKNEGGRAQAEATRSPSPRTVHTGVVDI